MNNEKFDRKKHMTKSTVTLIQALQMNLKRSKPEGFIHLTNSLAALFDGTYKRDDLRYFEVLWCESSRTGDKFLFSAILRQIMEIVDSYPKYLKADCVLIPVID